MTLELVRPESRDTIGRFNSNTVWERGGAQEGPDMYALIPFGAVMSWETGPDKVYISEGFEFEVLVFDDVGTLVTILREFDATPTVGDADRDAYRDERLAEGRPHPDDVPFAERFGSYRKLLLSYEGELWAQWAQRPADEGRRWTIWSADRTSSRRVVLPDINVQAVRGGRVYGYLENALGIQTVVILSVPVEDKRP